MGKTGGDTGENDDRDAVAQTPLGDLLAQPHQEHGPGDQRHDGGQAEHEAGSLTRLAGPPARRRCRAPEKRQADGAVARVLRDLAAPASPSFFSASSWAARVINCMMIDAEMYGMIPSAKMVKRDSAPRRTC